MSQSYYYYHYNNILYIIIIYCISLKQRSIIEMYNFLDLVFRRKLQKVSWHRKNDLLTNLCIFSHRNASTFHLFFCFFLLLKMPLTGINGCLMQSYWQGKCEEPVQPVNRVIYLKNFFKKSIKSRILEVSKDV